MLGGSAACLLLKLCRALHKETALAQTWWRQLPLVILAAAETAF